MSTKELGFLPPSSKEQVPVTLAPFPNSLRNEFNVDEYTYVTVGDAGLVHSISRYVASNGNKSFVIHRKNQSSIETTNNYYDSDDELKSPFTRDTTAGSTGLALGLGLHKYTHEKTDIFILMQRIGEPVGTNNGARTYDVLLLFTHGVNKYEIIQKFIEEIIEWDEQTHESTFNIYKYTAQYNYWSKLGTKIARPMDSVVLPPDVKATFVQDLEDFLSPETYKWYKKHGIPYKRSYLLYGPPGSGKSSIIQALAGQYKLNLCYIQPIDPEFTDSSFTDAIQSAPKNALIVLEDIDTYFTKDRKALHPNCPLTFSGLLNGLDGVAAADGQVFILTTNFIDKLDSALIRTGRVDAKFEFPKVSDELSRLMYLQFYPDEVQHALLFKQTVSKILSDKELCMADLQQYFISNRKTPSVESSETSRVQKLITGEKLQFITEQLKEQEEKIKKEIENEDDEPSHGKNAEEKVLGKKIAPDNESQRRNNFLACVGAGALLTFALFFVGRKN